jgi:hypothetical protein
MEDRLQRSPDRTSILNPRSSSLYLSADTAARLAVLLALALAVWLGLLPLVSVPAAVPATAPETEFSAERALAHSRVVNAQPHPMGTPAHAAAQEYIVAQLQALGLRPEVQRGTAHDLQDVAPDTINAGHVENIVARLPGTHNTGALLLMARYDTAPTTPSAADAGSGAITVLETLRALRAGPPLENDLIVLFHDSEVNALLGSSAFAEQHPWMAEVALAFEFNAAGNRGPTLLAYASEPWLLEHALRVAPRPHTYSFLTDILALIGGPPDLSVMVQAGKVGIDFTSINNPQMYHTMLDSPRHLDPGMIQHNGSYLLTLTQHFGNLPLEELRGSGTPLVAFSVLPGVVVRYSSSLALPLAIIALIGYVAAIAVSRRRGQVRLRGVLLGAVASLLALFGAVAAGIVVWMLIRTFNPNGHLFLVGVFYGAEWYWAALALLGVAVTAATCTLFRRWVRVRELALGALLWWLLLAGLTALALPGFSYVFTWPLLAGLAAALLLDDAKSPPVPEQRSLLRVGVPRGAALAMLTVPVVALLVPVIAVVFAFIVTRLDFGFFFFVPRLAWSLSPFVGLAVLFAALAATALLPQFALLSGARRWRMPVIAAIGSLLLIAVGTVASRFSVEQPRMTSIAYALDADTSVATWRSLGRRLDPWTEQFFTQGATRAEVPGMLTSGIYRRFEGFEGPAPLLDLPAPEVSVTRDVMRDGVRELALRLTSPRGASNIQVEFNVEGEIVAAAIHGQPVDVQALPVLSPQRLQLVYIAVPPDGVAVTLQVRSTQPITLALTDYSHGLPDIPGMDVAPRPPGTMPMSSDLLDPTSVRKTFTLAE